MLLAVVNGNGKHDNVDVSVKTNHKSIFIRYILFTINSIAATDTS